MKPGFSIHIAVLLSALAQLSGCGNSAGVQQDLQSSRGYQISGASIAGELKIQRIELLSDAGHSDVTLAPGAPFSPLATIRYSGRGPLRANWVFDDQIIEQVNINLSHGSLLHLNLKSSTRLPGYTPGTHQLSLQIKQPSVDFKLPSLKIFVTAN